MPEESTNSKKLGRPEELSPEELLKRYRALKQFLEHNWGRIALQLLRVRKPDEVRAVLQLVPAVEWCTPFRGHALCLIEAMNKKVSLRKLAQTRRAHKNAVALESELWSQYHSAHRKADDATTALKAEISRYEAAIGYFPFFFVIFMFATRLGVEELTADFNRVEKSLREAQSQKQALGEQRSAQDAWYARNEVVKFARNRRYNKTPANFARAMSGMPEYGWLYSLRKCPMVQDESPFASALNYQLFELLRTIIKKVKPLTLKKVEAMLKKDLLKRDHPLDLLKGHFGPEWSYIAQAFAFCVGKGYSRKEMPYKLMAKIQENLERGKTIPEIELAKQEQLI